MRTDDYRHNPGWLLLALAVFVTLAVIGLVSLVYWATRLLEGVLL